MARLKNLTKVKVKRMSISEAIEYGQILPVCVTQLLLLYTYKPRDSMSTVSVVSLVSRH